MKKRNKVIKPNVVGGGVAIPLGNNFYFMRGRKHEQGGIDIGPNNKNGLEVEGGEVMQMGGKHVKVYSSLPILNGKSPAQLVMAGLNPDKVFNAQERFKDINRLNDDGSRKAKLGIRKKLGQKILDRVHADGYWGGTDGISYALDQLISNKDGAPLKRIKEMDIVNDKYNNNIPLSEDEAVIFNSGILDRLNQIKQHRDALKLYLGYPQDFNTMEKSPYQGIVNKNKKTYQINDLLTDDYFNKSVIPSYSEWKSGKNSEYVTNLGKTAQLHDQIYLNNAGMSEGYDKEKGHYISVFDTWDYNTKVAGKHGDNIGKFIGGKPFDLYHRFYLDEWNDIPEQYRGAKWLPDMVVKPNGYHTETMNLEDDINFDASSGGFKYGGKKHFTINGNIVNKAGYVPSTGELPKANLGTVASIDKHVTRKDKDGRVANILRADIQKQIDTYNASKKYRDVKSAEIKRKTLFDREKEISRNPNIDDKIETSTVKKETNNKIEKVENKNKTNTNNLNINYLYPNRFGNLTNPTIKLEGNDVPLSALPQLAIEAVNRKLMFSSKKDVDPESKGLNIPETEIINKGVTSKINLDTIPKIDIEKPIVEKYPANITGDTIMYTGPSNMGGRRYYLPQSIDLSSVKGGYRNRGDYRDIETQGLVLPTMHEFYRFGDLNQETIKLLQSNDPNNLKGLIGLDKEGNIKVGRFGDFNEDDIVSVVSYDNIRGFNKNDDGTIKWAPRSDRWSDKYVFTETTSINPITGKDETGSINVGGSRANPTDKAYGFLNGGHVVIKAGDEVRLISGSVSDIDKEIEKMKIRNNVDNVEFFMLDNGTYNLGLRTTDGVLKASDLKRYDNQNTAGGHGIYLKRFGGMSKRQKAKGGKDIFSPRGLGIQATMTKMQADAWDRKHPGEYNPFAQQFIDEFGDPTIYSSIMSDNANARRIGIDRGYKGNIGLGFNMPELPNINLDDYFNTREDIIDGANKSGGGAGRGSSARSGSGVSGGRRPEVKSEPLKKLIAPKSKGVTVEPIKPPTQITVKTPEIETKNKGTWWRDNGSDLISGVAKGGASLASYLINRNMLNDLKYTGQPIFTPAAKLKTKININPQIDVVNRTTAARNANVSANTASSKVRNARMNNNYIDRLGYLNELYGMKENKETELINADKLNQQEITKGNIQAYNDWVEKKQNFDNAVREKQSENAVSFVSNLASGIDDIIANRQKRKQFKQNVAAYMASHPNVSPELLESYGLDIFGDIKKTDKSGKVVKSDIKIIQPVTNTKIRENEEYLKWLEKNDPKGYKNYIKRKAELDEKTKKLIREQNLEEYRKLTQQ